MFELQFPIKKSVKMFQKLAQSRGGGGGGGGGTAIVTIYQFSAKSFMTSSNSWGKMHEKEKILD